jgi:sarcosine oxidase
VIVVGAGIIGLSAGFELSRSGHRVTVLSADVPGSRQSVGLSRIFRLSHPDRMLTDAAGRSLTLWEEWEQLAGRALLDHVGLLLSGDVSDREIHLQSHGGLQHLSGRRHPLAIAQPDWFLEPTGAITHAEATIRFLQTELKVTLGEATSVDDLGVTLIDGTRLNAERVVVCAGPDTYRLLGLPEPERKRSIRFSFALRDRPDAPAPCWIHRDTSICEPFYAIMDGPDHYSVGLSEPAPADVSEREHIRDAHRRILQIVTDVLPGLVPIAERVIACEYSLNPNLSSDALAHDGWDMRAHGGTLGVTGPSLFKFAPLLGRMVVEWLGD